MIAHLLLTLLPVTNPQAAPPSLSWQVTAPASVVLGDGRAIPLLITKGDTVQAMPQVVLSTLRESATSRLIRTDQIRLCRSATPPCDRTVTLAEGANAVYLVLDSSFTGHGEFKGVVHLASAGRPTLAVELTVYGSSRWRMFWGWMAIVAGVFISILSTAFLRQYSARLDALAPAALLVTQVDDIETAIMQASTRLGAPLPNMTQRIATLRAELSLNRLDALGFLPARFYNPVGTGTTNSAAYAAYLAARSDQLVGLSAITGRGLNAVVAAHQSQPNHQAVTTARDALDLEAQKVLPSADSIAAVDRILAAMYTGLAAAGAQAMGRATPAARLHSVMEIRSRQTQIAAAAWLLLSTVTIVAGGAILILSNHGFGVPMDYIKCLFWGLGIQTAGQQLQQLTPGGIATSLKLSAPA